MIGRILTLGFLTVFSSAQVISANYKTFKDDVLDSPHVTMVKFYARK